MNGTRGVVTAFEHIDYEQLKGVHPLPDDGVFLLPKVLFQTGEESSWVTRVVLPEEFSVDEAGKTIASRVRGRALGPRPSARFGLIAAAALRRCRCLSSSPGPLASTRARA